MKKFVLTLALGALCLLSLPAFAADVPTEAPADQAALMPTAAAPAEAAPAEGQASLFETPVEAGACCFALCYEQEAVCMEACGPFSIDPAFFACRNQCRAERDICTSSC